MKVTELGFRIGSLESGPRDSIADVAGVLVGHCTVDDVAHRTGVTVLMPCGDIADTYKKPFPAAAFVSNGFGKSCGIAQIDELGTLETPIAFTGTLNVGAVHDALVGEVKDALAAENIRLRTVNPIVCECNDNTLGSNGDRPVHACHLRRAISLAASDFAEGDVGAGRGMICHDLKGGIGSASRVIKVGGNRFTLGVITLTNYGALRDLMINGRPVGEQLYRAITENDNGGDSGSVIVVAATDAPLSSRQLKRVAKRAAVGLARCGSYFGHGSGDFFFAFSTANRPEPDEGAVRNVKVLTENRLDIFFRAMAESTEEAVLNSMLSAAPSVGWDGRRVRSLAEFIPLIRG